MAIKTKKKPLDELAEMRRRYEESSRYLAEFSGIFPWNAPGMPNSGPNFLAHALAVGDGTECPTGKNKKSKVAYCPGEVLRDLYRDALLGPEFSLDIAKVGGFEHKSFVPGHIWGLAFGAGVMELDGILDGPFPANVMVIGKMPGYQEVNQNRNMVGPSSQYFQKKLSEAGFKPHGPGGYLRWYVTNLVRFEPPGKESVLKAPWIQDCLPLLHQEFRLVRPKFLLCLGKDAASAVMGKKIPVSSLDGIVRDITVDLRRHPADEPLEHVIRCMAIIHPAQVYRDRGDEGLLVRGLRRFKDMMEGHDFRVEKDLDHRVCSDITTARKWLAEGDEFLSVLAPADRLVGIDAEWQGDSPHDHGAYLRTVQISWREKQAICFRLKDENGKLAFRGTDGKSAVSKLMAALTKFMADKRPCGHYLQADIEWLEHYGFKILDRYQPPLLGKKVKYRGPSGKAAERVLAPWERYRRGEGGLDSALMLHVVEETAKTGLEHLTTRFTEAPRYDLDLEIWKSTTKKDKGSGKDNILGYGDCPDSILLPYACYDADVALRCCKALLPVIGNDRFGLDCWEILWEDMTAHSIILETRETGMVLDLDRLDRMTEVFYAGLQRQIEKVQTLLNWPKFSPRSRAKLIEWLFGEKYNGTFAKTGEIKKLRPDDCESLRLKPLLDTSKPPRTWDRVVQANEEMTATPGTGRMILGVMIKEHPKHAEKIQAVQDCLFLYKAMSDVLWTPTKDPETDSWMVDDTGHYVYPKGVYSKMQSDGKVRTHYWLKTETGRWASRNPNLQNWASTRSADYARILGKEYVFKLRSLLRAPAGKVLIEFDFKGAELFAAAIMAGDKVMIDHCLRNKLEEDDPNYYDIHSAVAVQAFGLTCPPTKAGLKSIGKAEIRNVAKTVIFGALYGRQAKAIAMASREQGNPVTEEEAQAIIDAIFAIYPNLNAFFEECRARARGERDNSVHGIQRYLTHGFHRYRRFPETDDEAQLSHFEREAMNFPIQSSIASLLNRSLVRLRRYRDEILKAPEAFRIALQIHDAAVLVTEPSWVDRVVEELVPKAVSIPFWPYTLDGKRIADLGPFEFGVDFKVCEFWGESMLKSRCLELGISEKYGISPKA